MYNWLNGKQRYGYSYNNGVFHTGWHGWVGTHGDTAWYDITAGDNWFK